MMTEPPVLEVFDPVPWASFCERNIDRLKPEDLARGLVIRFRWVFRQLCVTAVFAKDLAQPGPSANGALDLHIAGGDGAGLWARVREFAEEEPESVIPPLRCSSQVIDVAKHLLRVDADSASPCG